MTRHPTQTAAHVITNLRSDSRRGDKTLLLMSLLLNTSMSQLGFRKERYRRADEGVLGGGVRVIVLVIVVSDGDGE